jgi:hypothetical protein
MHTSALAELDVRSASILGIAWVNWFSDRLDSCSGLLIKPIKQKENIACNHASYSIGKDNTMNNEGKDTLIINGQAVRFKMVRNADGSTSLKRVKPKEGNNLMNNATYTIAARKDTSTHAFTPIGLPKMTLAQARDVLESKQTQGDGFNYVIVNTAA